jgi:hypothetical protein
MKAQRPLLGALVAAQIVATSCTLWSQKDRRLVVGERPAEISAALHAGEMVRAVELSKSNLRQHVGEPAPDLILIDKKGKVVHSRSMSGRRLAILAAISSCPVSVAWMKELQAARWRPPDGFDDLVVLIASGDPREWNALVRDCPSAYLVGWPLTGFYSNLSWEPAMFAVSRDGRFEGFWSHGEEVMAPIAQSAHPNHSVIAPVELPR